VKVGEVWARCQSTPAWIVVPFDPDRCACRLDLCACQPGWRMEDAAAKVVALKAKRDAWMSQRSAAMERENMRNAAGELVALDGGDGKVNDDLVLDRITERITSRLREELRIEVQGYLAHKKLPPPPMTTIGPQA